AHSPEEILNLLKGKNWDLVVVKGAIAENISELERRVRSLFPTLEFRVVPSFATALMGDPVPYTRLADFAFDAFDLLLGLIERGNAATRARAQTNARYAKLVAQRLMLPRKSVDEVFLAAYLDALGDAIVRARGGDVGDRASVRRLAIELFRNVNPPYDIETVLTAVEERFDGGGPRQTRGELIPMGARILAVVFGYNDAKGIPRDKLQKFLREMSGKIFDPRIVETFLQILKSEELLGDVGGVIESAGSIFLVDKDVNHTSTLELRLANEGYKVSVFADGQQALDAARANPPSLVIAEIAVPRVDGYNLLMTLKGEDATANVPFVFVSGKNDEFNQNKALDMGADDFIGKPVNVEFLLKKLAKFLVKPKPVAPVAPSEGVRGRLADLGLIELIQTLALGMKTAKLDLTHPAMGRASMFLEEGRIVACDTADKHGEEAFYQLATWADGDFVILANHKTDNRNVAVSNDFLILEALRRIDEGEAGISQDGKESTVKRK
ncbi:MAG TPA: response regulator, partial [bacterium]|nr:response regulator [bacterium]